MDERDAGRRTTAGVILAVGLSSLVASGCPWGAANSTGNGGASEEPIDDSAEVMVGTYRVASVARSSGDCEQLETTEPKDGGTVEIGRMETGAEQGEESDERLRVAVCEERDGCGGAPELEDLEHIAKGQGWRVTTGEASVIDGAAAARRCRLEWTTVKVVRDEQGVRIERSRRSDDVTLEGDMPCRPETAEALGEELSCAERTVWRANKDRG